MSYGYNTWFSIVPLDGGLYARGDTATVVSFSSAAGSDSNVVQELVLTGYANATNIVVSGVAIAIGLATAL